MKLYKGLPLKIVQATDKKGTEHVFGVTTETVDYLVTNYLLDGLNEDLQGNLSLIEKFDNNYSYGVPDYIFEGKVKGIIEYIDNNIENNYFLKYK